MYYSSGYSLSLHWFTETFTSKMDKWTQITSEKIQIPSNTINPIWLTQTWKTLCSSVKLLLTILFVTMKVTQNSYSSKVQLKNEHLPKPVISLYQAQRYKLIKDCSFSKSTSQNVSITCTHIGLQSFFSGCFQPAQLLVW